MSNKLQLLLFLQEPKPYLDALAAAGVTDRCEIEIAKPAIRATPEQLAKAEVALAMNLAPGLISELPRVKWIQSLTVGVDQWLARDDLKAKHTLIAARGTHRVQMPENILGALFHITKRFHTIALNQAEGRWQRSVSDTLAGKTLGILGLGAIGQELARKAAALEMRVIGTKRTAGAVPGVDRVYAAEQTDQVLAASDFVVLLLPATPDTVDMIDATRLGRMKPTAWLVNFARGALIVDDDLIAAVKAKRIAGAVLDVFRTEPLPAEHAFWRTPGITVLPHIGGLHPERDQVVAALFADNVRRHLAGETLREVVDRTRGY